MKKEVGVFLLSVFLLSVFLLSFVVAVEVTVIDEPDSFSGAILKIKSPISSSEYGEKIYPSENYYDAGVLKFDVETSLSEVDLLILLMKDGEPVMEIEKESVDFSNDTFVVDLREPVVVEVVSEEVNESVVNELSNETGEFVGDVVETTGNSIIEVGRNFKYYSIGVVFFLLFFVFLFIMIKMAYKSGAKSELKSLGRMELDEKIDELER